MSSKKKAHVSSIHLACFALLIILLAGLNLVVYFSPQKTIVVQAKDDTPLLQVYYLRNILDKHPTYREGWVALAELELQIGRKQEAQEAINKIKELDPTYDTNSLQNLLSTK